MKAYTIILLSLCYCTIQAQPRKPARMAALFVPGYYINQKKDTVKGQVQINPDDPTEFYGQFAFISGKTKKPKILNTKNTTAYGFEDRDFVAIDNDGQKVFAERLTSGRLRLLERKFHGKVDGYEAVDSDYYIRDVSANANDADLSLPKKISKKYYKKSLKPYLKDQPMIWSDLDKFTFDKSKLVQAINEFNSFYSNTGS
jgi:hypothetical protein